eukprot:scaffold2914_cov178-Amphora_coffeaeformis.AAC.2
MEPYTMCSRKEVNFRQKSAEISVFEATLETADRPPSDRQLDPTKAVKKYRRSAAGGISKDQQYPPRSLEALHRTIHYLTDLLIHWQTTLQPTPTSSFLDLVHFVEDRLRAVQVDLVVSQYASKEMQYNMVKFHILTVYVLSDTSKYERRHGRQALHTALSSYWNQSTHEVPKMDDEVLALSAMMQLDDDLSRLDAHPEDSSSHIYGAGILAVYRKHMTPKDTPQIQHLPRFQWALRVISCCNTGEWTNALRLLHQECCQEGTMFGVRVACLLTPSLVRIRAKALQAYNVSFMKNERLATIEVARLLSISDPVAAAKLCTQFHLPVGDDDIVSFKSAPIHMEWKKQTKRDDAFVFGGQEINTATDSHGTRIPDEAFLVTFFR